MKLEDFRKQLDTIDDQILALLNQRIDIVEQVGDLKREQSQSHKKELQVYAPHREKQILARLHQKNHHFPIQALDKIYGEIISACRSAEKSLKIAFLGPVGTFGHATSLEHFGSSVEFVPITPQADIFSEVESKRVDYGVIAIENSTYGSVRDILEMFHHTSLQICGERMMKIDHNLMSISPLSDVKRIYSHEQAFAQCRFWLKQNLSNIEFVRVHSTAEAARLATNELGSAAIASRLASKYHRMPIIAKSIMDNTNNMTRFLIIGHHTAEPTGQDRTSILFGVRDKVGSLADVLTVLRDHRLNMSKIESLPSQNKTWEYVFFADFSGHQLDPQVSLALPSIREKSAFVKVLGSYPTDNRYIGT